MGAILDVGWREETVLELAMICAIAAFTNTTTFGVGIDDQDLAVLAPLHTALRREVGYDARRADPVSIISSAERDFGKEATNRAVEALAKIRSK